MHFLLKADLLLLSFLCRSPKFVSPCAYTLQSSKLIFFCSGKPSFPPKFVFPCAYTPLPPAVRQRGTWRPFPCPLPSIWEIPSSLSDHTLSQIIPESAEPTTKKSPTHHICWKNQHHSRATECQKKFNRTQLSILSVSHNIMYMRVRYVACLPSALFYFAPQENLTAKLDWTAIALPGKREQVPLSPQKQRWGGVLLLFCKRQISQRDDPHWQHVHLL